MEDFFARFWNDLTSRIGGPMTFRIILQPMMAILFALRDGLKDARTGRPAYLWTAVTDQTQRATLVREGWAAIARVFFLAIVMDVIYQLIVHRWIYPGELLITAVLLAVVPYAVIRGPINRIATRWRSKPQQIRTKQ